MQTQRQSIQRERRGYEIEIRRARRDGRHGDAALFELEIRRIDARLAHPSSPRTPGEHDVAFAEAKA